MTTGWRKIARDIGQDRVRSALAVAAIALGISAFLAVLSSYAILDRELDRGYRATNPASATVFVDALDDDLLAAVRALPDVAAAEARRAVSGRIKTGPSQWRNLTLFVVRDFADIRVSTITPEQGAWPPGPGEILIERDAFQVARTRIGDSVTVRLPRGTDRVLRVAGRVHDVGQAQARMENVVYGYVTLETLELVGEAPFFNQLKILVAGDRTSRPRIERIAAQVRQVIEGRQRAVRRIDVPEPGRHPHADLMGMLLVAISSLGLLALALSGVLVVNLLTALLASQVRQIGMMKAIGGTRGQLTRLYLGQALIFGVTAVVVAMPLGTLGGRVLCRYMAVFLNFDITSFAVPLWVYLLVALVGVVTPLAAAWWPVARGVGVPVSTALADYGLGDRHFGTGALDRAVAGVGGLSRPLLLAVRNSFRRRTRLALTIVTLCVGGVFFMSALNIRTSMIGALDRLFATRRFDLSLNLGTMYPVDQIARAAAATPGAVGAEGWIVTEGAIIEPTADRPKPAAGGGGLHGAVGDGLHDGGRGGEAAIRFPVLGVQPGTRMHVPDVREGRALDPEDTDAILVNSALASRGAGIRVGETLRLRMGAAESTWRVVGVARESFSPPAAYVPRTYFERAGGHVGSANSVRVAVDSSARASIDAFREDLDRNFERENIRALSSSTTSDSRFSFDQHMVMVYVFLVIMSAIFGGVGGLGLTTTMTINVLERRREMGVLRAIGAPVRVVWLIVVAESLVIGLIGFVLAALLAWPLTRGLGSLFARVMFGGELDAAVDAAGVGTWFVVSLAVGGLASFVPAWSAARSSVREALACE